MYPIFIFKKFINVLSSVICDLFNESIVEGSFPDCLKVARVIPVYKADDRCEVSNYRPISTLSVLSKLFERLMYKRLISFLNNNDIICKHQFGFKVGCSTSDAIVEFLDCIYTALNNKMIAMPVYLDFSKAFDTVNHNILCIKLQHYGIRGTSLNWFKSYLANRKQYINIHGCNSSESTINLGVPQGSILGPALFLIYINDMYNSSPDLKFIHFADDTTIFATSNNERVLYETINKGLSAVNKWLKVNRLSLNIKKTKYMLITNSNITGAYRIRFQNRTIKRTDTIKFLGIMLDDKLSFKDHISYVTGKLSRSTGIINRIAFFLPFPQLLSLYYTLVYPHLTYGVTVWGKASVAGVTRMQGMQRRALRIVAKYHHNARPKLASLLNFDSIYRYFTLIKLYKVLKEHNHEYFHDRVMNVQVDHGYPTRFKTQLNLTTPFFSKNKCLSSFVYQSISAWNKLPYELKSSHSVTSFKKELKEYLRCSQAGILQ